ncbi:ph domain-containing protein [Ophiostoma piceae UAMH 11346]|uniref:Ph domain-containing protein n=1 Tax=Ophiostoma piceae (strain UAMH 11346) TaxID=1262450 RepID=S3CFT0_OPHP1|nr:ph domain-containing protein [Ophiostoma piceae UAMH 11346]
MSLKSPLTQVHAPAAASASAPQQTHLQLPNNHSGYFQQPTTNSNSQSHSQSHTPSNVPARSPYTESQSFMPSTQEALATTVDSSPLSQSYSQAHLSTTATGGNTPLSASVPYRNRDNYDSFSGAADSSSRDFAMANQHQQPPVAQQPQQPFPGRFAENWDASQRGSSILDGADAGGTFSDSASAQLPSRSNTLKKKASLRRGNSLHRSSSRRSMKAGSVRSLALRSDQDDEAQSQSAFYCPVPTHGSPTEVLANRFTAWRKILKDLIAYHREVQNHYEQRAKSLQRLAASLNNTSSSSSSTGVAPGFIASGGLGDATGILRNFHKQAVAEAVKAREVEEDVILALTGLRSDLSQKIKEIKNISGDFRNNVEKEMEATKRAVKNLQDHLGQAELDTSMTTGRQDPYLLRLIADRQLERQIQEENYLHQAFLNLERSGRELESIVVGEVQKSYSAYVGGILRRETGLINSVTEELRAGPLSMPKDEEWTSFIYNNSDQFVDPDVPLRLTQFITYPGQDHAACQEIRAGLLERKTKYLKSYTAGWYVLSPTHLHEFKSADKLGAPIMSLYLPEQKLGAHSAPGASSSKFALKGRQTGGLHRGHTWYFRAESYDTMMAWYEAIQAVTEQTGTSSGIAAIAGSSVPSRSTSRASQMTSTTVNSNSNAHAHAAGNGLHPRPTQGGRFPSDLQVNAQRGLEVQAAGIPVSPTSVTGSGSAGSNQSTYQSTYPSSDYHVVAAAAALPGQYGETQSAQTQVLPVPVPVPVPVQSAQPAESVETQTEGTQTDVAGSTEKTANGARGVAAAAGAEPERPELKARQASEALTISNLHIPGEYPRK